MNFPALLALKKVSGLRISPNGSKCAFLVHTPQQAENNYKCSVYISDYTNASPLGANSVTGFVWANETTLIISRDEMQGTVFYKRPLNGDPDVPYAFAPFSATIEGFTDGALLISALRPITEEKAQEQGFWTVLDELPVWKDGVGYSAKFRRQLFLCNENGQPQRISPTAMDVREVSADNHRVVYAGCTPETLVGNADEIRCWDGSDHLVCKDVGEIVHIALGKNTIFLAALAPDSDAGAAPALMQVSPAGGTPTLLCNSKFIVGNHIVSDSGSQGCVFAADGDVLSFVATVNGSSQLYSMNPDGVPQCLTTDSGSIDQLDSRAGRIVFAGLRGCEKHEAYLLENGEQIITSLHTSFDVLPMEAISCEDAHGWAIRQKAADRSRAAVLVLHDGPQKSFGECYHFGMQLLASKGYVVLFVNLPGSVGYGNAFASLGGRWGDDDFDVLIRFLDIALESCPEIDPARLAIMGTGYGAYLAATAIGKSDRFTAAICDGVISNCVSMEATSDHGVEFSAKQMKASAYTRPDILWAHSPLSRIASMKTPTLILHGDLDRSSHLSQGQMLFTSLKIHNVPTRMCIFPGESHNLAATGTPACRDRYLTEILRWLEMYL